jgi:sigma-B regulation protein RsbU (phosphoserine phosphatase)
MQKISWHQTLAFKLFILVSTILFLAIAALSIQNSKQFGEVLKQQNKDNLQVAALAAASSFQNNVDYWSALANSIGHMSVQLPLEQLETATQVLLDSNQGLAAVQIVASAKADLQNQNLFLTSRYESADAAGKPIADIEKQLRAQGQLLSRMPPNGKIVYFKSLATDVKIPLVQIATRMTRIAKNIKESRSSSDSWVILSIWQSTMTAAFQSSKLFSSSLMDPFGQVVLQAAGESASNLYPKMNERDFQPLASGQVRSRTWLTKNHLGDPVMVSASKLSDLNLFVVAQKLAKQDQDAITKQTRNTLLGSWILFLLALGACYFAASGLTQRILGLVQSTWEIAAGNLAIHLPERNHDEVGILARSVNKMASDIQTLLGVREHAIRQQAELRMAEDIQKTLIPEKHSRHSGIVTQSYFKPATECAGDWWGRFTLGEEKILVAIADATGHGAHAAIIASLAYSFFATITKQIAEGRIKDVSAAKMVEDLNSVLYSAGHGKSTMTVFLLLFDTKEKKVEAVSAGHCLPFTMLNEKSNVIACSGGVLGAEEKISTTPKILDLELGQRFLLYTDGLFECKNNSGDFIKKKRLNDRLASWNMLPFDWLANRLLELVDHHFKDATLTDDITLVLIEYCGHESQPLEQSESFLRNENADSRNEVRPRRGSESKDSTNAHEDNPDPVDPETKTWVLL